MKKHYALKDLLFYAFVAILCVATLLVEILLGLLSTTDMGKKVLYLSFEGLSIALLVVGPVLFRFYYISGTNIHFHYFPFTFSWKKAADNIDIRWNQTIFFEEVSNVEIVRLTAEEKKEKVYYKHWFNRYLKIRITDDKEKYVYVGNYSKKQIQQIILSFALRRNPQTAQHEQ